MHTGFWWENLRTKYLEDQDVDRMIILKEVFQMCDGGGGMDWIDLAPNRDRLRALVNAGMNLGVP